MTEHGDGPALFGLVLRRLAARRRAAPLAEEGNFFTQHVQVRRHHGAAVAAAGPRARPIARRSTCRKAARRSRAMRPAPAAAAASAHQVTLGRLARECTRLQDGSHLGQGRRRGAGPARPRRRAGPLRCAAHHRDQGTATRSCSLALQPASRSRSRRGEAQGLFTFVEDDLIVPRGDGARLRHRGRPRRRARRRRRKPQAARSRAPVAAAPSQ